MTDPTTRPAEALLSELIQEWRDYRPDSPMDCSDITFRQCADELEALAPKLNALVGAALRPIVERLRLSADGSGMAAFGVAADLVEKAISASAQAAIDKLVAKQTAELQHKLDVACEAVKAGMAEKDKLVAKARLEEAEWWNASNFDLTDSADKRYGDNRVAALRAALAGTGRGI